MEPDEFLHLIEIIEHVFTNQLLKKTNRKTLDINSGHFYFGLTLY